MQGNRFFRNDDAGMVVKLCSTGHMYTVQCVAYKSGAFKHLRTKELVDDLEAMQAQLEKDFQASSENEYFLALAAYWNMEDIDRKAARQGWKELKRKQPVQPHPKY